MGTWPSLLSVVRIQLIFHVIAFCSFASEVADSFSSLNSSYPNKNILPLNRKYLMEPYFEKYGCLLDSTYRDFMSHEISHGSSHAFLDHTKLLSGLQILQHNLTGEGSHRHLRSSVRLNFSSESLPINLASPCEVIVIEKLPLAVFADPFELQHGAFGDARVFGDTNLELPSFRSNRSLLEVHVDIDPNNLSRKKHGLEISVDLPVHARYPPLEESGYWEVEMGAPDLFLCCRIEGKSHDKFCLSIPTATESETGKVVWRMPSGIQAHSRVVSVVTFTSAILSTVLIVFTSLSYSDIGFSKLLKQS